MLKIIENIKFPCGYEYYINIEYNLFAFLKHTSSLEGEICPLHGKNCKRLK